MFYSVSLSLRQPFPLVIVWFRSGFWLFYFFPVSLSLLLRLRSARVTLWGVVGVWGFWSCLNLSAAVLTDIEAVGCLGSDSVSFDPKLVDPGPCGVDLEAMLIASDFKALGVVSLESGGVPGSARLVLYWLPEGTDEVRFLSLGVTICFFLFFCILLVLVAVGWLNLPEGLGSSTWADDGFLFANWVIILALLEVSWVFSKVLLWD